MQAYPRLVSLRSGSHHRWFVVCFHNMQAYAHLVSLRTESHFLLDRGFICLFLVVDVTRNREITTHSVDIVVVCDCLRWKFLELLALVDPKDLV